MRARPMLHRERLFLALACTAACSLPRDADGTLHRVRNGVLHAGYTENPPWVTDTAGVERRLVEEFAKTLGARVQWTRASESRLIEDVHERKLDLVVGGLTRDGTWITKAAPTRPFHRDSVARKDHVWAAPPGENAWLVSIEKFLRTRRDSVPAMLAREAQ
jgi:polar amino acid transport system substrate-binding protein